MFYILATYQIMSITALNLTVGLLYHSVDEDIVKDILLDIEEEEKHIIRS